MKKTTLTGIISAALVTGALALGLNSKSKVEESVEVEQQSTYQTVEETVRTHEPTESQTLAPKPLYNISITDAWLNDAELGILLKKYEKGSLIPDSDYQEIVSRSSQYLFDNIHFTYPPGRMWAPPVFDFFDYKTKEECWYDRKTDTFHYTDFLGRDTRIALGFVTSTMDCLKQFQNYTTQVGTDFVNSLPEENELQISVKKAALKEVNK